MSIILNKERLLLVILGIILYIYIYNPPFVFLPFTPIKLLYPIAFFYLCKKRLFSKLITCYKVEFLFFICIIFYSFFRGLFTNELGYSKTNLITLIETLFLSYCFVIYFKTNIIRKQFIDFFINIAGLAAIISVILIFFPSINQYIRDVLLKRTEYTDMLKLRNFGFSEGLSYAYGIVQGIAFSFCLIYSKKKINLWLMPFFFISILFNARIGFVPIIIVLCYLLFTGKGYNILIRFTLIFLLITFILYNVPIFEDFTKTIEWGFAFFTQILDFTLQNNDGNTETFDILFKAMLVLPQSISEYIWGSGHDIFLVSDKNTDMGYLLQLNFGGIIYCLFLYCFVWYMFLRLYFINKEIRSFSYFFLFVIIIVNIKGYILFTSPAYRVLFIFYIYYTIDHPIRKNMTDARNAIT